MAVKKKLYRSRRTRIIAGLFGGLGDYYGVDPTILRLGFLLLLLITGIFPAIVIYFVAVLVVPTKN